MPTSKVPAIQKTLQTTNEWLVRIMQGLATGDPDDAYVALRVTLHALRDGLPPERVTQLGAQLPLLVRGIYYEGWKARADGTPAAPEEFLVRMRQELGRADVDPETMARTVLQVMSVEVIADDAVDVRRTLPETLRDCWRN